MQENDHSVLIIGDAIVKYKNITQNRTADFEHIEDYKVIDLQLLEHAQKELGMSSHSVL